MKFLAAVLVVCIAIVSVPALPAVDVVERSGNLAVRGTPNETGINNGYLYYVESSGAINVTYTNLNNGSYEVDWYGNGDFTVGKGWNPGSARYAHRRILSRAFLTFVVSQDDQLHGRMGLFAPERDPLCVRLAHGPASGILYRGALW
jgi:hypothetical protein